MEPERFVSRLASARIGATFNFYRDGAGAQTRRRRLRAYLRRPGRRDRCCSWVRHPGYRGARISGLPFTSERQLTGSGPAEATATVVQRVLAELELDALCWNVVPTHPGTETSNRRPTRLEILASRPFLEELAENRRLIAVGRLAARVTEPHTSGIHPMAGRPNFGPGCYSFAPADALVRLFREMKTYNAKPGEIDATGTWWTPTGRRSAGSRPASRTAARQGQARVHAARGHRGLRGRRQRREDPGHRQQARPEALLPALGYPGGIRSRTLREQLSAGRKRSCAKRSRACFRRTGSPGSRSRSSRSTQAPSIHTGRRRHSR